MNRRVKRRIFSCYASSENVRNGKQKIVIVAVFLLIGLPFFAWYDEWYGKWDEVNFTYDYNWINEPPLDSEEDNVFVSLVSYDENLNLVKSNMNITLRIKDDSIYIPILQIYNPSKWEYDWLGLNGYKDFVSSKSWIKGIMGVEKVRFKNNDTIGTVTTTAMCYAEYTDSINILSKTDSICMWGASKFGPSNRVILGSDVGDSSSCYVSFDLTNTDVTASIDREKKLISNFSSGFYVSTDKRSSMSWEKYLYQEDYQTFTSQAIPDLIIGKVSQEAPDSLPLPKVAIRFKTINSHYHGGHIYTDFYPQLDVQMNIIMADSTLMDQSKIYIKYWVDEKPYIDVSFATYGNPFSQHCVYGIELPSFSENGWEQDPDPEWKPWIRGYCYYRTNSGRKIISPEFSLNKPSEMQEVATDIDRRSIHDTKIYDLTGREVKEEELAPGIYIRNGRKFAVGR